MQDSGDPADGMTNVDSCLGRHSQNIGNPFWEMGSGWNGTNSRQIWDGFCGLKSSSRAVVLSGDGSSWACVSSRVVPLVPGGMERGPSRSPASLRPNCGRSWTNTRPPRRRRDTTEPWPFCADPTPVPWRRDTSASTRSASSHSNRRRPITQVVMGRIPWRP